MRAFHILSGLLVLAAAAPAPAFAQRKSPAHPPTSTAPHAIGTFQDWTAATNIEAGQKTCYAFTRARSSAPKLAGRSEAVLTVTERPTGRDAVAISAGYEYPANAAMVLDTTKTKLDFYTSKRNAFARDGRAAVAAFRAANLATTHAPGPKGASVTDTYSLTGFDHAYAAITRECPPK
jgi:hypothetical protein